MNAKIAEVKAKFSAFIRRAKAGQEITVFDRDVAVAKIIGIAADPLSSRPPTVEAPLSTLVLRRAGSVRSDPVEALIEARRRDRLPG